MAETPSDITKEILFDKEGKPAPFQPNDRVVSIQVPWVGQAGKIVRQKLQYDGWAGFWGNCIVDMDDGRLVEFNCWQLDREEGFEERFAAKEAARLAKIEEKERAELARLKEKYENGAVRGL